MKLAHTMIRVKDLDATLEFYTGFLGLKETRRSPIGDEAMLVFLEDGQASYQIELTVNHGKQSYELGDQFGHLAFFTEDLERVVADVEFRGWWYRRSLAQITNRRVPEIDARGGAPRESSVPVSKRSWVGNLTATDNRNPGVVQVQQPSAVSPASFSRSASPRPPTSRRTRGRSSRFRCDACCS